MKYTAVNAENCSKIRKGSVIETDQEKGKVIDRKIIESFGMKVYTFTLDSGQKIKFVKSTLW